MHNIKASESTIDNCGGDLCLSFNLKTRSQHYIQTQSLMIKNVSASPLLFKDSDVACPVSHALVWHPDFCCLRTFCTHIDTFCARTHEVIYCAACWHHGGQGFLNVGAVPSYAHCGSFTMLLPLTTRGPVGGPPSRLGRMSCNGENM